MEDNLQCPNCGTKYSVIKLVPLCADDPWQLYVCRECEHFWGTWLKPLKEVIAHLESKLETGHE